MAGPNNALNNADLSNGRTSVLAQASVATLSLSNPQPTGNAPIGVGMSAVGASTASLLSSISNGSQSLNADAIPVTFTAAPSGAGYTGGTLTRPWVGLTASNFNVTLVAVEPNTAGQPAGSIPGTPLVPGCSGAQPQHSQQILQNCTFTAGSAVWACPSTQIAGSVTTSGIVAAQL